MRKSPRASFAPSCGHLQCEPEDNGVHVTVKTSSQVQALQMRADCAAANAKRLRDLFIRESVCEQGQDFLLAR